VRLLVLGGTRFVGRAFVEAALARGHELTLFNRGRTNPDLFRGVETIHGDRTESLAPLAGREWDAVVDVAAYFPRVARLSTEALRESTRRYLYVSSISVYADQSVRNDEEGRVAVTDDLDDTGDETYGARKAASEDVVREAFGERATIVRPGLIVGPHDPTDRFDYWPKRIAAGGRVLAPGDPGDPVQFVDVRDLAAFMHRLLEDDRGGTFNATGRTLRFGDVLDECLRVAGSGAELVWIPSDELLAEGLSPWMGIPLWIAAEGWEAANRIVVDRALAAGLELRPLGETVRAALADETEKSIVFTLPREREAELLAKLRPTR
jgi:2'-hydroxyisoflavone reductase